MDIVLHEPSKPTALAEHYRKALKEAVELYIVSAYLTEWDPELKFQATCRRFRLIVGKDFGITRKEACLRALRWLPSERKGDFLVADQIIGFHPKAAFWRDADGQTFMLVGSSNLTRAAFGKNIEANVFSPIPEKQFLEAKQWIAWIEERSVPMSESWLEQYVEASRETSGGTRKAAEAELPVVTFQLPMPTDMSRLLRERREQLSVQASVKPRLVRFFRNAATGAINSAQFLSELRTYWDWNVGNRIQGKGWERRGGGADFNEIARAFVTILDASKLERDDVVREELDLLHASRNPARKAFLSEMLCLCFPAEYPVWNDPVKRFLATNHFKSARGATEGTRYVDMARKLRAALRSDPTYPAKNLAELDTLIWVEFGGARNKRAA